MFKFGARDGSGVRVVETAVSRSKHPRARRRVQIAILALALVGLLSWGPIGVRGSPSAPPSAPPLPVATRSMVQVGPAHGASAVTGTVSSPSRRSAPPSPAVAGVPDLSGLGSTWNGIHLFSVFGGSNSPGPAASWSGWDWGGPCPNNNPGVPSFQYYAWTLPPNYSVSWVQANHPNWLEYNTAVYQNYTGSGWTTSSPLYAMNPNGILDMTNPAVQNYIIQYYVSTGAIGPSLCDGLAIDMYHSSNTDAFQECVSYSGGNCVSYLNSTTNLVGHYDYSTGTPVWVSQYNGSGTADAAYETDVAINALHYFSLRMKMEAANLSMPNFPIVVNDDGWEGDLYGGGFGAHTSWYYGSGPYWCGGWDDPMGSADILMSENGFDGISDGSSLCMTNTWLTMVQSFIMEDQVYNGGIALIGSPVITGVQLHEWWSNITVGTNSTAQAARGYLNWTLGNYLLIKGNHTWFYIADGPQGYTGMDYWEPEYAAPIGHPTGPLYDVLEPTGSSGQMTRIYMRNYSGGLVAVNPSRGNSTSMTFPAGEYVDLEGNPVTTWNAGPVGPWGAGVYGSAIILLDRHLTPSITATPSTGPAPLTVDFTGAAGGGSPPYTAWAWRFGDGTSSSQQDPTHLYSAPGTYLVTLNVTDSSGAVATATLSLTVSAPSLSVSSFGASPASMAFGGRTYLNVTAAGGSGTLSYAYAGLPAGCSSTDGPSLPCTPTVTGSFEVRVYVNDTSGQSATSKTSLTVDPVLATVALSPPTLTIGPDSATTFNASATCLGGSCPASGIHYAWSLSNGLGNVASQSGSSAVIDFGTAAGTVSVWVNATFGSVTEGASSVVTVVVAAVPALESVLLAPTTISVGPGSMVTFAALPSCSAGSCPGTIGFTWALSYPLGILSPSSGASTVFTAGSSGGTALLTVKAVLNGKQTEANATVTVVPPATTSAPTASPPASTSGFLGLGGEMDFLLGLALGLIAAVVLALLVGRRQRRSADGENGGGGGDAGEGPPAPGLSDPSPPSPERTEWANVPVEQPGPPYHSGQAAEAPYVDQAGTAGSMGPSWALSPPGESPEVAQQTEVIRSRDALPIAGVRPAPEAKVWRDETARPAPASVESPTPARPIEGPSRELQGGEGTLTSGTPRPSAPSPGPARADALDHIPRYPPLAGIAIDSVLPPPDPSCFRCGAPLLRAGHPCILCDPATWMDLGQTGHSARESAGLEGAAR